MSEKVIIVESAEGDETPEDIVQLDFCRNCPCGEVIVTDQGEDSLVEKYQAHLDEAHPGTEHDRDTVLSMAYAPDVTQEA